MRNKFIYFLLIFILAFSYNNIYALDTDNVYWNDGAKDIIFEQGDFEFKVSIRPDKWCIDIDDPAEQQCTNRETSKISFYRDTEYRFVLLGGDILTENIDSIEFSGYSYNKTDKVGLYTIRLIKKETSSSLSNGVISNITNYQDCKAADPENEWKNGQCISKSSGSTITLTEKAQNTSTANNDFVCCVNNTPKEGLNETTCSALGAEWKDRNACVSAAVTDNVCCLDGNIKEGLSESECKKNFSGLATYVERNKCVSNSSNGVIPGITNYQDCKAADPENEWENGQCISKSSNSTITLPEKTQPSTPTENISIGFSCEEFKGVLGFIKTIYNLIRYAAPIVLVIMGSIDFFRSTIASSDSDMDKNKKRFLNRLFIAAVLFLLLSLFQLVFNILESAGVANSQSWLSCWNSL